MFKSSPKWFAALALRPRVLAIVGACVGIGLLSGAGSASAAVRPGYDIQESYTVSGDVVAGNIVNLNFTLTNVGTEDFAPTFVQFGETRPRAAFGEIVLPPGLKRQLPAVNTATDNPLILCEAYRGTHGGLTQAFFNDICRMWFYGTIPAGGSVTATIPVKLVSGAGDYTTWGGAEIYPTDPWGTGALVPLNGNVWMPLIVHVNPAPPKVGGGGVAGGGLPDLQATAKASTASPAAGASFYVLFTAKNAGKVDATDATFSAVLPDGLTPTFASWEFGECTTTGMTVACTSSRPISSSLAQTVQISLTAPPAAGTFAVSGSFADSNGDSNPANNAATLSIKVR